MAAPKRPTPAPKPQPRPNDRTDTPIVRPTTDPWTLAGHELAALAPGLPVALLPVRLETRFTDDALLVRVYPDTIHGDSLRRSLSQAELDRGRACLRTRGKSGAIDPEAWRDLIAVAGGPWRAAWALRAVQDAKPATIDDRDPGTRMRLLPRRWVVVGTLAGEEVIRAAGREIPADLLGGVDLGEPNGTADELLDQPGMRWMVDFERAIAQGMALRIPLTGAAAAVRKDGLDTLLVFGASALPAADLQRELADLLEAHHYTRGAGFMAQGEPTNRGAKDPNLLRPDPAALLAREMAPTAPQDPLNGLVGPAASALARALGLTDSVLGRLAGATDDEQEVARAMNTVIWPTTIGGLLWSLRGEGGGLFDGQPPTLLAAGDIEAVRTHFIRDVRGAGPLPTLRIGPTSYGFLPVCGLPRAAPDRPSAPLGPKPSGPIHTRVQDALHHLLVRWQRAAAGLPVIDPGADDSAADAAAATALAAVLAGQPWPTRYAVRTLAPSPLLANPSPALMGPSSKQRDAYRARLGLLLAAGLADEDLPPLGKHSSPATLCDYDDDVIGWAAPLAELPSARATEPRKPGGRAEVGKAGERIVIDKLDADPSLLLQLVELARAALRDDKHPASRGDRERELADIDAAFKVLQGVGAGTRGRVLGQSLSLAATRLDAWLTATATRRLAELRARTPTGLLVGGWGVVHDLQPARGQPAGGYVLTPSLGQAAAAVALRSGHAAYSTGAGSPFAVDLSSERVRLARWLYDGVRQGQSLAALLGQRFERILHEHGADHLVRDVREAALAARGRTDPPLHVVDGLLVARALSPVDEPTRPEQDLAARLAAMRLLAELGKAARAQLAGGRAASTPTLARTARRLAGAPAAMPERELGELVLAPLRDALDALADTAMFEATHQLFTGQRSAAATTLAAVDRGEAPPPALHSLDTPRAGVGVTHRLVLLLAGPANASPWPAPASAAALAEPRLEGWAAAQLGERADIRATVEHFDEATGALLRREPVSVAELAPLAALDFCRLAAAGPWQDGPLAARLLAGRTSTAGARLRLGVPDGPPAGDRLDLAEAHALAARLAVAWRGGRPSTAAELSPLHARGSADPLRRIDRADLTRRLTALQTWLTGQATRLAGLAQAPRPAALACLAEFTAFAAPSLTPPAVAADEPDEALRACLTALDASVAAALKALASAVATCAAAAGDEQALAAFTAAVRPLVDDGVPLLPVYAAAAGLARHALGNLVAVDEPQIAGWLAQLARVRPRVDALDAALRLAEARHAQPSFALRAGQTGLAERWAAVHRPAGEAPCVCVTAVLGAGATPDGPLAALALDAWSERVPARDQLAGLAMQYQSPAARAPQVVLLATPSPGVAGWSLDELQRAAASALTLAQIRPVTSDRLEQLGHLLPCIFLDGKRIPVDTGGLRQLDAVFLAEFMPQIR